MVVVMKKIQDSASGDEGYALNIVFLELRDIVSDYKAVNTSASRGGNRLLPDAIH